MKSQNAAELEMAMILPYRTSADKTEKEACPFRILHFVQQNTRKLYTNNNKIKTVQSVSKTANKPQCSTAFFALPFLNKTSYIFSPVLPGAKALCDGHFQLLLHTNNLCYDKIYNNGHTPSFVFWHTVQKKKHSELNYDSNKV